MEKDTKEMNLKPEEASDPKLKELVDRFNELVKDCIDAGYSLQTFTEQGIRIVKIQKSSPILKGFRGFKR